MKDVITDKVIKMLTTKAASADARYKRAKSWEAKAAASAEAAAYRDAAATVRLALEDYRRAAKCAST